jgi:hypothetical protein
VVIGSDLSVIKNKARRALKIEGIPIEKPFLELLEEKEMV